MPEGLTEHEIRIMLSRLEIWQWLLAEKLPSDFRKIFLFTDWYLIFSTEVWNFELLESQIMDPFLPGTYSRHGLFLVDVGFCSKGKK